MVGKLYIRSKWSFCRVMGGYSYQKFENSGLYAENYNFTSDALTYNNLGDGTWYKNIVTDQAGFNSWKNESKLIAFFGRASYDYNSVIFLQPLCVMKVHRSSARIINGDIFLRFQPVGVSVKRAL